MTQTRTPPPKAVPTLTEVVEFAGPPPGSTLASELAVTGRDESMALDPSFLVSRATAVTASADDTGGKPETTAATAPHESPEISEEQVVQRVLVDLQRQIDTMLEYRLREALAPTLARMSEVLARDVRNDIASTLRDVVARAVAQELSRHRVR